MSSENSLRQELIRQIKAELCRRSLIDFVEYIKEDYITNWHHLLLCEYLDKFIAGEITKLMVFMPPQHGKSELVSRMLPAYLLGKNPAAKVVLASYSATLASSFNRECQRYIDSDHYRDVFPNTKLSTGTGSWLRNNEIFEIIDYAGFLKTVGVGGSLTGTPADFAIIDDPVKDSLEASSPTYQQRNWDWYNDVLNTRLHNNSSILITQTRWDENDLSGMLLTKQAELGRNDWVILCLPAIKEINSDIIDPREVGEALWESQHSKERLLQIQKQSMRTFQSLYQQNPQPTQVGGEFYKQFKVEKHVRKTIYNSNLALHFTLDFNVRPGMHGSVHQIETINGIKISSKIREIFTKSPNNNTKGICAEFSRIFKGHISGLTIYGDPSGNNEDTRTEEGWNDFRIVQSELAIFKPQLRVSKAHPSVAGRGDFINTVFEGGIPTLEFIIGDNCPLSIKDYLHIKEDSDRTKLKSKVRDPETGKDHEKYGHMSDGDDNYYVMAFAIEYSKYQAGGSVTKISQGRATSSNNY